MRSAPLENEYKKTGIYRVAIGTRGWRGIKGEVITYK